MLRRPTIIMTFDMLVFLSARTIKEIQRPLSVTSDEEQSFTQNVSPISLPLQGWAKVRFPGSVNMR